MPKPVFGISPGITILKNQKQMGFTVKGRKHRSHYKKRPKIGKLGGGRFKRKRRTRKRRRRRRKRNNPLIESI